MVTLEVILGMMFTYMVLSMLGTTIIELISSWRGWRGSFVEEGLKRLLEFEEESKAQKDKAVKTVFERFTDNEFYKQMMQHKVPFRVSRAPSWLKSENFVSILVDTLKKSETVVANVDDMINDLPADNKLRKILEQFRSEGHDDLEKFKARVQNWYDDVMEHSHGWYKRHVQMVTFFVGLVIAISVNADSFNIYYYLSNNATARQSLSNLAEAYVANNPNLPAPPSFADSMELKQRIKVISNITNSDDYKKVSNVLGLGWHTSDLTIGFPEWMKRILGWIVTAFAISLGAPFWYASLKGIINIRSSGSTSNTANTKNTNEGG